MTLAIAASPTSAQCRRVAFVSACLHIISPAGLFLSAPNAESSFAFLNFSGYYLYALGLQAHQDGRANLRDAMVVLSGLFFGVSTAIWPTKISVLGQSQKKGLHGAQTEYRAFTPGCKTITGKSFQHGSHRKANRPRNVGFLRYWTISNAPLFLLAAPMLFIMISSGLWFWPSNFDAGKLGIDRAKVSRDSADALWMSPVGRVLSSRVAITQVVLGVLALTTYHVQIITRISSGYALWYWWLASSIVYQKPLRPRAGSIPVKVVVRWMVLYALIQAGLFAAFLPPA
ncbi:MAG: hypothetical protein Q9184_003183 [Pyrenodesmia sp. 2 TL-2023]